MPHPGALAGGHVVLCGLNELGYRMVEQLHDLGVPVVAAERHEGNRSLPAVRRLETALNVQALNPEVRVVQRLFDPDLAARVERAFGIHISHSPSALAAPTFAAAAAGEHVLATIAVGAEVLAVVRLRVTPRSRAQGRTVAELESAAGSRVLQLDDGHGPRWPGPRLDRHRRPGPPARPQLSQSSEPGVARQASVNFRLLLARIAGSRRPGSQDCSWPRRLRRRGRPCSGHGQPAHHHPPPTTPTADEFPASRYARRQLVLRS